MKKLFLYTFLGFTPYWNYKPTDAIHVDSPGLYTSENLKILSTIVKSHLKSDVNGGSVVNGSKQLKLYSFVSDKPPGFEVFIEPETIHYKKNKQICFECINILIRR